MNETDRNQGITPEILSTALAILHSRIERTEKIEQLRELLRVKSWEEMASLLGVTLASFKYYAWDRGETAFHVQCGAGTATEEGRETRQGQVRDCAH